MPMFAIQPAPPYDGQDEATVGDGPEPEPADPRHDPRMLRILLIDPSILTRECFVAGLARAAPDLVVTALKQVPDERPDPPVDLVLVVAALRPLASPAVEADIAALRSLLDAVPVMMIGASNDPQDVAKALEQGVRGYISTDLELKVAVAAIRLVAVGGRFIPASSFLRLF